MEHQKPHKEPYIGLQRIEAFLKHYKVVLSKILLPLCVQMAPKNAFFSYSMREA